jgi:diacylglycerol kinase family enzyme
VLRHRQVEGLGELHELRVDAVDDRRFPVQVDGDYIGEFDCVRYSVVPGGLVAVA